MFHSSHIEIQNSIKSTQSKIDDFCKKIKLKLPNDYQQFLLEYNGIIFRTPPCFYLPEINQTGELRVLYGFDFDTPYGTNLEKSYHYNFNYDLDGSTLVIGHCNTDVGLLCIMLVNTPDMVGVYACDLFYDEFFFEESSDECNIFKIADSFSEFLIKLVYPTNEQ